MLRQWKQSESQQKYRGVFHLSIDSVENSAQAVTSNVKQRHNKLTTYTYLYKNSPDV